MKSLIQFSVFAIAICYSSASVAAVDPNIPVKTDSTKLITYDVYADQYPEYPGGIPGMTRYIQEHVEYPELAYSHGHEGTVLLEYVIEKDGSIGEVKVVKKVGLGCDEAAVAVFKNMPRWEPARRDGEVIAVRCRTPVKFSLF